MFEFLKAHQLNIMLSIASMTVVIAVYALITNTMPKKRKMAFVYMELSSCILLLADRLAYIYRGDTSELGFWMVRICNFLVFFLTVAVVHSLNLYISDLCREDVKLEKVPRRLIFAEFLASVGWFMIIVSQFTGLYYTFDDQNRYQRGPGFFVCYIIPLIILFIHFSVVIQYYKQINCLMRVALLLFTAVPILASIVQLFTYGLSLTNIAMVGLSVVLYIFAIIEMNEKVERANKLEIEYLKEEKKNVQKLFEQTATAFATAINSKDQYTKGHSLRVAQYSRKIAEIAGKDEKECGDIFYSALLHDVGKMGISDTIINKDVGLTDEEYNILKEHPVIGGQILSPITDFPLLSIGAVYHHERYDGKGYPKGLKGDEIPEMARIISVADTYDAMTSKRSYRDPLPQSTVREEIIKASGIQLDPIFSNIMVDLIDQDIDYLMKEDDEDLNKEKTDLSKVEQMHFGEYKEVVSDGIRLSSKITKMHFETKPDKEFDANISIPTFILFDSYDGCVHKDEHSIRVLQYLEYAEIWLDGHLISTAARNVQKTYSMYKEEEKRRVIVGYDVVAVKYRDHVKIEVQSDQMKMDVVVALPDATKHAYLAISGEHCTIRNVKIETTEESIGEDYIGRIADEISYIDRIEGDVENLQVDDYHNGFTKGVPVADGMRMVFRTMSLPTAKLIWHCAHVLLYTSDDGTLEGDNYQELACIRLDGENIVKHEFVTNEITVHKNKEFEGWDDWKTYNKKGYECQVLFLRKRDRIILETENRGIAIRNTMLLNENLENVYVALTGERCALTDIRILN